MPGPIVYGIAVAAVALANWACSKGDQPPPVGAGFPRPDAGLPADAGPMDSFVPDSMPRPDILDAGIREDAGDSGILTRDGGDVGLMDSATPDAGQMCVPTSTRQYLGIIDTNCDGTHDPMGVYQPNLSLDIARDAVRVEGESSGDALGLGAGKLPAVVDYFSGQAAGLQLLIGNPGHSINTVIGGEGAVYITDTNSGRLGTNGDKKIIGDWGWGCGRQVANMGDQNRDGYADFLFACPGPHGVGHSSYGLAFYVHGRPNWQIMPAFYDMATIEPMIQGNQSVNGFAVITLNTNRVGGYTADSIGSEFTDVIDFDGHGEKVAMHLSDSMAVLIKKQDFRGRTDINNLVTQPGNYVVASTTGFRGGPLGRIASGTTSSGQKIIVFSDGDDTEHLQRGQVRFVLGNQWPSILALNQLNVTSAPPNVTLIGSQTSTNLGVQIGIEGQTVTISNRREVYTMNLNKIAQLMTLRPKERVPFDNSPVALGTNNTPLHTFLEVRPLDRSTLPEGAGGLYNIPGGFVLSEANGPRLGMFLFVPHTTTAGASIMTAAQRITGPDAFGSINVSSQHGKVFVGGAIVSANDPTIADDPDNRGAAYMFFFNP